MHTLLEFAGLLCIIAYAVRVGWWARGLEAKDPQERRQQSAEDRHACAHCADLHREQLRAALAWVPRDAQPMATRDVDAAGHGVTTEGREM